MTPEQAHQLRQAITEWRKGHRDTERDKELADIILGWNGAKE